MRIGTSLVVGQRRLGEGAVAKVGALALRSREVGAREAASRRLCPLEEGVCEDGALGEKIAHRREGEDHAAKVGALQEDTSLTREQRRRSERR